MATNATPVLQLETEKQPAMTLVHCAGKVLIESCNLFSTTVRALIPEGKPIRVDLSKVTLVDSLGIGTFVSVWASAKNNGCDLKFINPSPQVQDLVEITRLQDMFEPAAVRV
jgi:anti-sigma B factor antagonist